MSADWVASGFGFLVTVMILSYLIGDNPVFRIAVHVFVGVAAGYVAAVAWWQVLLPDLILPLVTGSPETRAMLAVPLLLSGLLLMKGWPPLSRLGSPALGMLVGVAAAVAIGGAIQGTLLPQALATIESASADRMGSLEAIANAALVLGGVISTLTYFHFSTSVRADGSLGRPASIELVAGIGSVFLAITLGVLFAGVYSAALTALIERLYFLGSLIGLG